MDLKKNLSLDTKKLIESVATQMLIEMRGVYGKAAGAIAYHWLQPEIEARQERGLNVWAGQVVFTGSESPILRINEEVKGKVEIANQQRLSPKLLRKFKSLKGFEPNASEQEYAHVVVVFRGEVNGRREAEIMYHNLERILPPRLAPSTENLIVNVKACQGCGRMFITAPHHPHQKFNRIIGRALGQESATQS